MIDVLEQMESELDTQACDEGNELCGKVLDYIHQLWRAPVESNDKNDADQMTIAILSQWIADWLSHKRPSHQQVTLLKMLLEKVAITL